MNASIQTLNPSGTADCTLLVASCDAYADVVGSCAALLAKYWPDCPFEKVLVTESPPASPLAAFTRVIACGSGGSWSSRLVRALDEISTAYVLMLCDDYLLKAPVDTALILRRLGTARQADAVNLRLVPNPVPQLPFADGLGEYRKNTAYCISTLAGIWNRQFLRRLADGKSSIWEFERYGSFDLKGEKRPILGAFVQEFPFVDAVHKGCWEPKGLRVLKDNGLAVDLAKRGLPSLKTRFVEGVKACVFACVPNTWIVSVQNRLNLGMKEKRS